MVASAGGGKGSGSGKGTGKGTGQGEGEGEGIGQGIGEKSGTASPAGAGTSGSPGPVQAGVPGAGEKKEAEGALGVPGAAGQERYAAVARSRAGQIAPEKQSGVKTETKGSSLIGPSVRIVTPTSGRTSEMTQYVKGVVSDPKMTKATLSVNNDSRVISVIGGRFEAAVGLTDGRNVITVMAFDRDGNAGKDSITLTYSRTAGTIPVAITEPRNGQVFDVSRSSTVKVRGTVGDNSVKKATMILNGRPKDIVVKDGRFSQEIALTQEKNTVAVEAIDAHGGVSSSDVVGFATMNVKPKDIMVILTWDKPNADFDLHVYGPLGGHTSYKNPNIYESNEAIPGAQIEQDAKGNFGPEVFTMERADRGTFTIKSNYFYSGGDGDAHATVTVILYGDNPARRIVRVFGPHLQVDTKTGEETWDVARFKMPEGIFLEE